MSARAQCAQNPEIMNPNAAVDQADAWIKRISLICLLPVAASMIVKPASTMFGVSTPWRGPPMMSLHQLPPPLRGGGGVG
jgi:hypothetical protein